MTDVNTAELLSLAKKIVHQLENDETDNASKTIDDLAQMRESELFQKVGKLTRNVHNSIVEMGTDKDLTEINGEALPDARDRLNYVIEMTEQSAHKTMSSVEEGMDLMAEAKAKNDELSGKWKDFLNRKLSVDDFNKLTKELANNFEANIVTNKKVNTVLTDILLAQSSQDVSGQIIKKVITLVEEVEIQLIELLDFTSKTVEVKQSNVKKIAKSTNVQAEGPGMPTDEGRVQDQDEVDDLLASLGF